MIKKPALVAPTYAYVQIERAVNGYIIYASEHSRRPDYPMGTGASPIFVFESLEALHRWQRKHMGVIK